jgi:hypothetical protein
MQIAIYISDLLYRHDCVVVPDFGAFISRRVPAQHFASSHNIYPPKKGLSFNAQIKQNDGLLASYTASVAHISYDVAVQEVRNYVRLLGQQLEENGTITIPKIGRFTQGQDKALQFTPLYLVNYLPEAFGLASHEIFAIDRAQVTAQTTIKEVSQGDQPVVLENSTSSNTISWVRYAAAAAIVLGLGYTGSKVYEEQANKNNAAIEQMANATVDAQIENASFLITDPLPSITINVAPLEKNYHIVAGAFRDPANADKRVAQLQRQGYDAQRIGVNKYGLHNVAFSSFEKRNDAISELNKLRAIGFENAWLFVGALPKGN